CYGLLGGRFFSTYQLPAVISTGPASRLHFGWFQISRQVLSFLLFSYRRGFLWFPRVVVRGVGQVFNHLPVLDPQANRRFTRTPSARGLCLLLFSYPSRFSYPTNDFEASAA